DDLAEQRHQRIACVDVDVTEQRPREDHDQVNDHEEIQQVGHTQHQRAEVRSPEVRGDETQQEILDDFQQPRDQQRGQVDAPPGRDHAPQRRQDRIGGAVQELADRVVEIRAHGFREQAEHEQRDRAAERELDQQRKRVGKIDHGPPSSSADISAPRRFAACSARSTSARKSAFSKTSSAAAVVPCGEVTRLRNSVAVSLPSASMWPAPRQVCAASARAVSRGSPSATAASSIASTSRKKYAGPEPDSAVTVSICASSSIQRTMPAASSRRSANDRCAASTLRLAQSPAAPAPTSAGVLGMQRTIACLPPSSSSICAMRTPAAMEINSGFAPRSGSASALHTARMTCGFTASTTQSAPAIAATLSLKVGTPNSRASASRASAR